MARSIGEFLFGRKRYCVLIGGERGSENQCGEKCFSTKAEAKAFMRGDSCTCIMETRRRRKGFQSEGSEWGRGGKG